MTNNKNLKGKSLRFRINLWYTVLMCVMSVALIGCIVATARFAGKTEAQQNLIRSVERNMDEIEVESGILDIESDFAYINGNVYVLVFGDDGRLLGGSYPDGFSIDKPLEKGGFEIIDGYYIYDSNIEFMKYEYKIHGVSGKIISAECDGVDAYSIYKGDLSGTGKDCILTYQDAVDIALGSSGVNIETAELILAKSYEYIDEPIYEIEFFSPEKGHEDIWVRGLMKTDSISSIWDTSAKIAAIIIPLLIILVATVGRFISTKAMLPIKQLSETISETRSGNDLTKRIRITDSDPALIKLTEEFNAMFERLGTAFETEAQFTSDVSHELRTPVSVILAECEYQLSRDDLSEEDRDGIETVRKQADSMKQIVSQLLFFSRMEQGREKPDFQKESLSELVSDICDDISALADRNIRIEKDIEAGIEMKLDIAMITRLVSNLLMNGITYGNENGKVCVILRKNADKIILKVSDDGIGIGKEHIEKIWQRFYRIDKSRSREKGCSGLGLPMVKQIAGIHGGTVYAESEEGKGSTFTVEFPC